jgi:endonuclease/exonuclease/phosphatase (EEP) superfamily protein YafD
VVASLLAGATALATVTLLPGPAEARRSTAGSDLTVIQANLLSPQADRRFQRDAREVLGYAPDLITYNEVAFRKDSFLAPPGYAIYRPPGRYQRPNPVVWNTNRFTALDTGTFRISNWRGRPPGRETELGRRWANWVTLAGDDGRTLTLVSIHIAPKVRGMPDLRLRSVKRLGTLVGELAQRGPVIVGGDFNMHHRSAIYPEDLFAAADLHPTYDLLGNRFPTGDHGGATIDFLFVRGTDQLTVDTHFPVELNSDHDAVVAGMSWRSDPDETITTVSNNPRGARVEQRAVVTAVRGQIGHAGAGDLVQLATRDTSLSGIVRALRRAAVRGARVQVTTRSTALTPREQRLRSMLHGYSGSWVRRCVGPCATAWQSAHPVTKLLLTNEVGQPVAVTDVNRRMDASAFKLRSRAVIQTGPIALSRAQEAFRG